MKQPPVAAVVPGQNALSVQVLSAAGRIDLDEHVLAKAHGLLPEDVPVLVGWRLPSAFRKMTPDPQPLLPNRASPQPRDCAASSGELALEKVHTGVDRGGRFDPSAV